MPAALAILDEVRCLAHRALARRSALEAVVSAASAGLAVRRQVVIVRAFEALVRLLATRTVLDLGVTGKALIALLAARGGGRAPLQEEGRVALGGAQTITFKRADVELVGAGLALAFESIVDLACVVAVDR